MTETIRCKRCRVPVEIDKIDMPDRCTDPDCPVAEQMAQRKAARLEQSNLSTIFNAG
jgi:hypothetical protein